MAILATLLGCQGTDEFRTYHTEDIWDYVKAEKNPYGLDKLPLILMPTYPSSGHRIYKLSDNSARIFLMGTQHT